MALEDILAQAASSAIPQQGQQGGGLTSFGPTPIVQPPPVPHFQTPQPQQRQTSFPTVGARKRADRQAVLSSVAQFVKAGGDYVTAKKTRTLQMNIERLMEAQQGISEAQQTIKQNPTDPDAMKALEKNTAIVNDITKDPKINKQLQKAFNIDLFGDGKNKQENQALIEAWKNFDKKQQAGDKTALNPIAQRLMQAQPQRQQLNPQAQQQAMAIKAGLIPNANETLKATTAAIKMNMEAKTAEDKIAGQEKAAETLANARIYGADKVVEAALQRSLGQQTAADIVARSRMYSANATAATWNKRLEAMKDIAGMKTVNPMFKQTYDQAKVYTEELTKLAQDTQKAQAELDKKGSSWFGLKMSAADSATQKMLRMRIMTNNMQTEQLTQQLDKANKNLEILNKTGAISSVAAGSSGDSGQEDDIVVSPEDMN